MTSRTGCTRRGLRAWVALSLATLWLGTATALAGPGDLDGSFGTGGKALANIGGDDHGRAMALQPDGKILVAGESDSNFAVARLLNPQGTLDTSFGGGTGRSVANLGGSASAVALQPDGRIVVAGSSGSNFAVARLLNPQGTFDTSFGGGSGMALHNLGGTDIGRDMALQPDGRIVVAGSSDVNGADDFALVRLLNPQGTLDTSFAGSGKSFYNFGGIDRSNALALQPDGKIVLVGVSRAPDSSSDIAIARVLNPQGTPDTSFGGANGKSLVDFGFEPEGRAVALQPDGKIVVAGDADPGRPSDLAVVRLLPGGGLDNSFGTSGKSGVDFGSSDFGHAMALQPDGKIIVAGVSDGNFVAARWQPNGQVDTTFGNAGKAVVDFGGNADSAWAVALQRDGKIVLAGDSKAGASFDFAVARLQGDPGGAVAGAPRCAGRRATIVGTGGADKLTGTPRRDVIVSLGGKDSIRSGRGADIVCAGTGNDRVGGGAGNDRLYGQSGRDRLSGNSGRDRLSGGSGRDRLSGGSGADRLSGGSGADRLSGGSGADRLRGGSGRDRLRGGPGRDRVRQ